MSIVTFRRSLAVACGGVLLATSMSLPAAPKGAKAIFDSGEGGTIGMSVGATRPAATTTVEAVASSPRYVGISYQIMAIADDGQMRPVSKNRVFRSGERIKILARTNRPGYLTVANIGSSGRMHVLFSDYVDAQRMTEIPPNTNLRFDGNPGTENVLIMLSNEPSPFGAPPGGRPGGSQVAMTAPPAAPAPPAAEYPPPSAAPYQPPAPLAQMPSTNVPPLSVPSYPLPPEQAGATMMASLGGAKSMKAKGAKDLVAEDSMQSTYAVVSPRQGFKAVNGGAKDLVMESAPDGTNYGVVPVAAIAGGGILTLEIKLTHR